MSFPLIYSHLNKYRKDHPFVFYFLFIYIGSILTYIIIFIIWYADRSKPMPMNELGDFLAGAFSPIAFLFLYLGYRQNSEALSLQAEELRQSTEALQLQVSEMKDSVEQQKIMGEFQRIELEERHISVTPILTLSAKIDRINTYSNSGHSSSYSLTLTLKNLSDYDARDIKFSSERGIEIPIKVLNKNSSKTFPFDLVEEEIRKYEAKVDFDRLIDVEFENIFGRRYSSGFILQFFFIGEQINSSTINLNTVMLIKSIQPN